MVLYTPRQEYKVNEFLSNEMYDNSDASHIVRLLKAFIGSGVGYYRKQYMLAQLRRSLANTHYSDIDAIYGSVLGLNRLTSESYAHGENMITADSKVECLAKDAKYKARIFKYLTGMNIGCTEKGVKMVAEASTGRQCTLFVDDKSIAVTIGDSEFEQPYSIEQYEYDGIISLPPDPVRRGYIFLGWYTRPVNGEKVVDGQPIKEARDITLYAKWQIDAEGEVNG